MPRMQRRDVIAGVFLVIVGTAFAIAARHYPFGSMARFGAGFFPFWLGVALASLGVLLAVSSLFDAGRGEPEIATVLATIDLRSFTVVIGSVVLFGLILTRLGLLLSVVILVLVSSLGSREIRWGSTLTAAVLLATGCSVVFVYGLGLTVPVLPAAFE
jgi:putative tricarboxylic transport membrane protein